MLGQGTAQAEADPYIGRIIEGQFRIVTLLGHGGMSAVYKAEQPSMNRFVAIKILHPRYVSRADLVTRFHRESRAMSQLTHPNTARVLMCGELEGGVCYFVMEYLEGQNLAQYTAEKGPMSVGRAVRIILQVCGALEEAHAAGIVHRDIKPENILLTVQGGIPDFPKVLDFGLAKVTERPGSLALTQEGAVFGTPEFMSPEQALGQTLDHRTDIYSLCTVLYEMITGRLPFDAKLPIDFIHAHFEKTPIPLCARAPERQIPQALEDVIMHGLAKKREERYQTAGELGQALKPFAEQSSATQLPAPGVIPASGSVLKKPARFGKGFLFLASALVLGLAAAFALLFLDK